MTRCIGRFVVIGAFALGPIAIASTKVTAASAPQTVVLPFRTLGVSDTTAAVAADLLQEELGRRGLPMIPASRLPATLPRGADACDDTACARAAGEAAGASQVVYGSLGRLGEKIVVRVRALRRGEATPFYSDQLTAAVEEDLDTVLHRVAEGIAAGRPNAEHATVETVTLQEALEPRRRASRSGIGVRAGFLFPDSDSYGGAERLGCVRLAFKYETRDYLIDSTPLLGFAWHGDTVEWSIFDLFAARIFGRSDFAPYLGGGLGVHSVHVVRDQPASMPPSGWEPGYEEGQSETTLTADVGLGLLMLRTYDLSIVFDVRYHIVFADFDRIGGNGAHGIQIMFGTSR